jgi:outer membrane lipoprotein-sorting protein
MIRSSLAPLCLVLALAAPAVALTGREVITSAQEKNGFSTWRDRTLLSHMQTFAGDAMTRDRDFEVNEQTDPRGEHRTLIRFTGPADVQGTRFLHLSPRGGSDQQWIYTPTTRRVRRLAEAQRDENFFGADLSYRDLELLVRIQQWNDDESTATLDPDATVEGHTCHVVTLVPKNEEFPLYSKFILSFGVDDALLWRVDLFDTDGKLFKRVKPRKYARVGKYATAMEAEIETVPSNTHTLLDFKDVKYDVGLPDAGFAVSVLDH